jgi:hypothetical protein
MNVQNRTWSAKEMREKHGYLVERRRRASAGYAVIPLLALLACPSYGDTPQSGWTIDTKAGCRVWNPRQMPNESVTWSGKCENGYAQGKGIEQWYSNGKPGNRIEGDFHDGTIHNGNVIYPNGDRYDGDLNGGRNGYGAYTSMKGVRYEGEWRDDKRNGRGVLTWLNGDRYEGGFRDGQANGHGLFRSTQGYSYDGDFRDGKREGQGVYIWANGSRYDGKWKNNKRNGPGTLIRPNGDRYDGEWKEDKFSKALYEITLQQENGVLKVPVNINGALTVKFTLDSGASDVSIPADTVLALFRTGTLTNNDFLGQQMYILADGSSVPSDTFRIRSLRIGNLELKNVLGSVSGVSGIPLLGQSFLSRLGSWSINNQRHVLVLEDEAIANNSELDNIR